MSVIQISNWIKGLWRLPTRWGVMPEQLLSDLSFKLPDLHSIYSCSLSIYLFVFIFGHRKKFAFKFSLFSSFYLFLISSALSWMYPRSMTSKSPSAVEYFSTFFANKLFFLLLWVDNLHLIYLGLQIFLCSCPSVFLSDLFRGQI